MGWILNGIAQCERNDKIHSGVKVAAATHDAVVQFPSILRKYAVGIKYFSNITGKKREREYPGNEVKYWPNTGIGAVSRKPWKLFGPIKPWQNLEPCHYRVIFFSYSKDEGRFSSYQKFRAYTLLRC